jgi:hypothetical protein
VARPWFDRHLVRPIRGSKAHALAGVGSVLVGAAVASPVPSLAPAVVDRGGTARVGPPAATVLFAAIALLSVGVTDAGGAG